MRDMTHHESFEHHDHQESGKGPANDTGKTCRVCKTSYIHKENPSFLGICPACGYKILIVLLIIMVATSYIAWFGVL